MSSQTSPVSTPADERDISDVFRAWVKAHRVELLLFVAAFIIFAAFSSGRFWRQSAAPHFIYQSKAWLEGRLDLDPRVLPNLEDWACARQVNGATVRCEGQVLPTDKWYVSFPWFPAVVMLPFVFLHGYQFNDTSFGVFIGALAVALFYRLLRQLRQQETERSTSDNVLLALTLGLGSVFFYCTLRGEVWFSAEVLGVALTCLYLLNAVRARRPFWAGVFFSMAVLTRTPLFFTGVFFLLEAICPEQKDRSGQFARFRANPGPVLRSKLLPFALGALPLAVLAAAYNEARFGHLGEFGHSFLFNNRVNADIDANGLFSPHYLLRNLQAAFFLLPQVQWNPFRLGYNPHGLTLLLTLPFLVLLAVPKSQRRLSVPLVVTVAACALPGLFYQNDGYMQFGFRFSLDYTPYLVLLLAVGGWSLKSRRVLALLALGFVVNFWGAAAFQGYTELVRRM
jgi:hypothetical protein